MNWIRLFYHNTESCILNNGWSSAFFKLGRGVRQGCPLSLYLFILCAEILAETIRKNENIKGITINEKEIKISQYTDDTTLILDGLIVSFTTSLQILDLFSEISGLRLNNKKTVALWICANTEKETTLAQRVIVKNSSRPPTVGRLLANRLPTGYQQITDSLPTDYRQLTNRLPTVGNLKKQGEKHSEI